MDSAQSDRVFASLGLNRVEIETYVQAAAFTGTLQDEIRDIQKMMVEVHKRSKVDPEEVKLDTKRLTLIFHALLRARDTMVLPPNHYEILLDDIDTVVVKRPKALQRVVDASQGSF